MSYSLRELNYENKNVKRTEKQVHEPNCDVIAIATTMSQVSLKEIKREWEWKMKEMFVFTSISVCCSGLQHCCIIATCDGWWGRKRKEQKVFKKVK